ncbi:hypothetical protein F2Q68_00000978 [Brassica cretica]|uniref:MADS-box domain-containing protein n=1 Tax=Brassica cretica TaxID=69181 RepID=A0A8S9J8G0_BRACR|nr:hypothetical protein F2Q68_00000978 [Brassica cretica]
MGRKMVKMARITNEKTRITTYRKRKECLFKKANEFSTLCGVNTCLIVYGPTRAGDERIDHPELWPKDERKVREIITKYRDTASSSCIKTYSVQECLEKGKIKLEKEKYCPWDNKLEKCSLNELYATFVTVCNKIQEAANRKQTFPDASWSTHRDQLGLIGYNQPCLEQHQLFPMSSMEQNGFAFLPFLNQMTSTSNTGEVASFSNMTEPEMTQAMFYGSCSDGQYGPMVQKTDYMEPVQWGLGNSMFSNVKPFVDYPMRNQQAQAALAQAKRGGGPADPPPSNKPVVAPTNNNFNSHAVGGNFQVEENRGFGRGNWGRGNGQGMGGGRGPGGQMRNRPGGMGGRGFMGNGGGGFGPMNMMHPQSMGFEQAFGGGPMARMGGYGGFPGAPGPPFPGILPSFPPVGGVGLPGVAPHVNPAFFGRGMPMGMMPNAGVDMGMWDPNSGGWGGGGEDLGGGRAAESSYGEEAASEHQYGEVNHDNRGARQNHAKEKERASEREWSGSSDRRNREDKDAGYERDMPREKDGVHGYDLPERRHRDDRETGREREREHHHKVRERSRDRDRERDRERDRHREERERYGGDHRSKHRDEPEHEDEWNRGRSSRGHSKSRLSREENHRSRSRDADYGKRRRLTAE